MQHYCIALGFNDGEPGLLAQLGFGARRPAAGGGGGGGDNPASGLTLFTLKDAALGKAFAYTKNSD